MKQFFLFLSLATFAAWAQPAFSPPQIGFVQDSAGSLRPVFGIAGNFMSGDEVLSNVVSAAYSGVSGMVKTDAMLAIIDQQGQVLISIGAQAGPALFAFTREGDPALVYLPGSNELLQQNNGAFQSIMASVSDPVISIAAPDAMHADIIVQRDDGLWGLRVRLDTGEVTAQAALVGVTAPVLALPSGEFVFTDSNGIVLRRRDGSERHIDAAIPESFTFQQMGKGWIQLRDLTEGRQFAIRIDRDREQLFGLPEANQ